MPTQQDPYGFLDGVAQPATGVNGDTENTSTDTVAGLDIPRVKAAIFGQESGKEAHPYDAVNPDSGATGKYQVMPFNIGPWTEKHLGRRLTQEQFRKDPDAQEAVADAQLREYAAKRGGDLTAVARDWYGWGHAGKGYPTSPKYAQEVSERYAKATGQVPPKSGDGGTEPAPAAATDAYGFLDNPGATGPGTAPDSGTVQQVPVRQRRQPRSGDNPLGAAIVSGTDRLMQAVGLKAAPPQPKARAVDKIRSIMQGPVLKEFDPNRPELSRAYTVRTSARAAKQAQANADAATDPTIKAQLQDHANRMSQAAYEAQGEQQLAEARLKQAADEYTRQGNFPAADALMQDPKALDSAIARVHNERVNPTDGLTWGGAFKAILEGGPNSAAILQPAIVATAKLGEANRQANIEAQDTKAAAKLYNHGKGADPYGEAIKYMDVTGLSQLLGATKKAFEDHGEAVPHWLNVVESPRDFASDFIAGLTQQSNVDEVAEQARTRRLLDQDPRVQELQHQQQLAAQHNDTRVVKAIQDEIDAVTADVVDPKLQREGREGTADRYWSSMLPSVLGGTAPYVASGFGGPMGPLFSTYIGFIQQGAKEQGGQPSMDAYGEVTGANPEGTGHAGDLAQQSRINWAAFDSTLQDVVGRGTEAFAAKATSRLTPASSALISRFLGGGGGEVTGQFASDVAKNVASGKHLGDKWDWSGLDQYLIAFGAGAVLEGRPANTVFVVDRGSGQVARIGFHGADVSNIGEVDIPVNAHVFNAEALLPKGKTFNDVFGKASAPKGVLGAVNTRLNTRLEEGHGGDVTHDIIAKAAIEAEGPEAAIARSETMLGTIAAVQDGIQSTLGDLQLTRAEQLTGPSQATQQRVQAAVEEITQTIGGTDPVKQATVAAITAQALRGAGHDPQVALQNLAALSSETAHYADMARTMQEEPKYKAPQLAEAKVAATLEAGRTRSDVDAAEAVHATAQAAVSQAQAAVQEAQAQEQQAIEAFQAARQDPNVKAADLAQINDAFEAAAAQTDQAQEALKAAEEDAKGAEKAVSTAQAAHTKAQKAVVDAHKAHADVLAKLATATTAAAAKATKAAKDTAASQPVVSEKQAATSRTAEKAPAAESVNKVAVSATEGQNNGTKAQAKKARKAQRKAAKATPEAIASTALAALKANKGKGATVSQQGTVPGKGYMVSHAETEHVVKGDDKVDMAATTAPGGVTAARTNAEAYAGHKLQNLGNRAYPADLATKVADIHEAAVHNPEAPAVKAAYGALATETLDQFKFLQGKGVQFEAWAGDGQPYTNSAQMMADVAKGHLYFFTGGDMPANHPLAAAAGVTVKDSQGQDVALTNNDVFRAVHDYFGHSVEGYQFGSRGELNATRAHAQLYSAKALPALLSETLAQNSWVNFGKHLRNDAGTVPTKGQEGYVAPQDRPFAEQKAFVDPELEKTFEQLVTPVLGNEQQAIVDYLNRDDVKALLAENPNNHLGLWRDGDKLYMDVSENVADLETAKQLGEDRFQYGIFDLSKQAGEEGYVALQGRATHDKVVKAIAAAYTGLGVNASQEAIDLQSMILTRIFKSRAEAYGLSYEEMEQRMYKGGVNAALVGRQGLVQAEDGTVHLYQKNLFNGKPLVDVTDAVTNPANVTGIAKTFDTAAKSRQLVPPSRVSRDEKVTHAKALTRQFVTQTLEDTKQFFTDFLTHSENYKGLDGEPLTREGAVSVIRNAVGWYTHGVDNMVNKYSKVFPELATEPNRRKLFTTLIAITSPGDAPARNIKAATKLYSDYRDAGFTGKLPLGDVSGFATVEKVTDAGKLQLQVPVVGYGRTGFGGIQKLNNLIDHFGDIDTTLDWLLTEHSWDEVASLAGAGIELPVDSGTLHGAWVLAPKVGAFTLNLGGILTALTPDLWFSRTWNRAQGTLTDFGKSDEPRTESERRLMRNGVEGLSRELVKVWRSDTKAGNGMREALGPPRLLSTAETQSLLWYMEQQAWAAQGHQLARSESYDDSADTEVANWPETQAARLKSRDAVLAAWRSGLVQGQTIDGKVLGSEAQGLPRGYPTLDVLGHLSQMLSSDVNRLGPVRTYGLQAQYDFLLKEHAANTGRSINDIAAEATRRGDPNSPGPMVAEVLYQRSRDLAEELGQVLARGGNISTDALVEVLASKPEYINHVAAYLLQQRDKLAKGKLTNRDVAKAYLLTMASIRATEQGLGTFDAGVQREGLNPVLASANAVNGQAAADFLSEVAGQPRIRPEDAMAKWLFTPEGKAFLDSVETGKVDTATLSSAMQLRGLFGGATTTVGSLLVESNDTAGLSLDKLQAMTDALNAAGPKGADAVGEVVKGFRGIGDGKAGFIKQLLGFGDAATVDAVEINLWLTGKGSVKGVNTANAALANDVKNSQNTAVQGLMHSIVESGFTRLAQDPRIAKQLTSLDLDPNVFNTVMHHWLWDRVKGSETSHAGFYKAMLYAQQHQDIAGTINGATIRGAKFQDPAMIALFKSANFSTVLHEGAHVARQWLTPEESGIAEGWVTKVTGLPITNGVWLEVHEEAFARGFEVYLLEGQLPENAPKGLKAIFDKVRDFMAAAYRDIQDLLGQVGPLDNDIRGVYASLLGIEPPTKAAPNASAAVAEHVKSMLRSEAQPYTDVNTTEQRDAVEAQLKDTSLNSVFDALTRWQFRLMPITDQRGLIDDVLQARAIPNAVPVDRAQVLGPVGTDVAGAFKSSKIPDDFRIAIQRRMGRRLTQGTAMQVNTEEDAHQMQELRRFGLAAFNALYPHVSVAQRLPSFMRYVAYYHPELILQFARADARASGLDLTGKQWQQREASLRGLVDAVPQRKFTGTYPLYQQANNDLGPVAAEREYQEAKNRYEYELNAGRSTKAAAKALREAERRRDKAGIHTPATNPFRGGTVGPDGLALTHYSKVPGLTALDPAKMGTGTGTLSRTEKNSDIQRTYFYLEGTAPESLVTRNTNTRYRSSLPAGTRIYDISTDPDGIVAHAIRLNNGAYNPDIALNLIRNSGYQGYMAANSGSMGNVVAMFGPVPVEEVDFTTGQPQSTRLLFQTRDLMAVHEVGTRDIDGIFKLGGLVAPSIGIVDSKVARTGFGNVSLIMRKEHIDPANGVELFIHDAYTPRFPRVTSEGEHWNDTQLTRAAKEFGENGPDPEAQLVHPNAIARHLVQREINALPENIIGQERDAAFLKIQQEVAVRVARPYYGDTVADAIPKYAKNTSFVDLAAHPETRNHLAFVATNQQAQAALADDLFAIHGSEYGWQLASESQLRNIVDSMAPPPPTEAAETVSEPAMDKLVRRLIGVMSGTLQDGGDPNHTIMTMLEGVGPNGLVAALRGVRRAAELAIDHPGRRGLKDVSFLSIPATKRSAALAGVTGISVDAQDKLGRGVIESEVGPATAVIERTGKPVTPENLLEAMFTDEHGKPFENIRRRENLTTTHDETERWSNWSMEFGKSLKERLIPKASSIEDLHRRIDSTHETGNKFLGVQIENGLESMTKTWRSAVQGVPKWRDITEDVGIHVFRFLDGKITFPEFGTQIQKALNMMQPGSNGVDLDGLNTFYEQIEHVKSLLDQEAPYLDKEGHYAEAKPRAFIPLSQIAGVQTADSAVAKRFADAGIEVFDADLDAAGLKSKLQGMQNVLFQSQAPKDKKPLAAVHNLKPHDLEGILDIGGFVGPSIAVVEADKPYTQFGDITVVFRKEHVDPEAPDNADLFIHDAWTPRFPELSVNRVGPKVLERVKASGFTGTQLTGSENWYRALLGNMLGKDNYSPTSHQLNEGIIDVAKMTGGDSVGQAVKWLMDIGGGIQIHEDTHGAAIPFADRLPREAQSLLTSITGNYSLLAYMGMDRANFDSLMDTRIYGDQPVNEANLDRFEAELKAKYPGLEEQLISRAPRSHELLEKAARFLVPAKDIAFHLKSKKVPKGTSLLSWLPLSMHDTRKGALSALQAVEDIRNDSHTLREVVQMQQAAGTAMAISRLSGLSMGHDWLQKGHAQMVEENGQPQKTITATGEVATPDNLLAAMFTDEHGNRVQNLRRREGEDREPDRVRMEDWQYMPDKQLLDNIFLPKAASIEDLRSRIASSRAPNRNLLLGLVHNLRVAAVDLQKRVIQADPSKGPLIDMVSLGLVTQAYTEGRASRDQVAAAAENNEVYMAAVDGLKTALDREAPHTGEGGYTEAKSRRFIPIEDVAGVFGSVPGDLADALREKGITVYNNSHGDLWHTAMSKLSHVLFQQDKQQVLEGMRLHQQAAQALAQGYLASQAAHWTEVLADVRKAGLLSSPRTHLGNIIGNTAFQLAEEAATLPSAMTDALLAMAYKEGRSTKFRPDDFFRSLKHAASVKDGLAVWEQGGLRRFVNEVFHGGNTAGSQVGRGGWGYTGKAMRTLEGVTQITFRLLQAEDAVFNAFAMRRSLLDQGRAAVSRGDVADLQAFFAGIGEPELDVAMADALFATFNNGNVASDRLQQLKTELRLGGFLGKSTKLAIDMLVPFDRTPTNLFLRFVDYSPLGLVTGSGTRAFGDVSVPSGLLGKHREARRLQAAAGYDARALRLLQREMSRQVGRGVFGTVLLIAAGMGAGGLLTGVGSDEDKRRRGGKTGRQPNSIKLFGRWWSLNRIQPLSSIMALGATIGESWKAGKPWPELADDAYHAALMQVLQLPMARGFSQVGDVLSEKDASENKTSYFLGSMAASFVPSISRDIAEFMDNGKQREAKGGKTGNAIVDTAMQAKTLVQRNVPGWRESLPLKMDTAGNPIQRNPWQSLVDPFNSTKATDTPTDNELGRLGIVLNPSKRLNGETEADYTARLQHRDDIMQSNLEEVMSRDTYRAGAGRKTKDGKDWQKAWLQKVIRETTIALNTEERESGVRNQDTEPKAVFPAK